MRLFELGRAYRMKDGEPDETRIVTIGATGLAREKGVSETPREYEFADLKGDLDAVGELAGGFGYMYASASLKSGRTWPGIARRPISTAMLGAEPFINATIITRITW